MIDDAHAPRRQPRPPGGERRRPHREEPPTTPQRQRVGRRVDAPIRARRAAAAAAAAPTPGAATRLLARIRLRGRIAARVPRTGILPRARTERPDPPRRSRRTLPGSGSEGVGPQTRGWFLAEEPSFRGRGMWLVLAFAAMTIAIGAKLVDVQLHQAAQLSAMAAKEHISAVPVHAHRGRIYDDQGRLLASDVPVYAVYADPGMIAQDQRRPLADRLAPVLGIGPGKLVDMLDKPCCFVYLAHQVSEDVKQRIADLHLSGIGVIPEDKRVYETSAAPNQSFASNLLGFVNHDGSGNYGVEQYYDKVLRGTDGSDAFVRDLNGNPIVLSNTGHQDARDGRDLRLGIDSRVQYYAEQILAKQVQANAALSGSMLVMDTKTGSIRAWADYPSYDANNYAQAPYSSLKDLSVDGLYEPGSVMKVVTFAGGLEHRVIAPEQRMAEHQTTVDGYTIHDWDHKASHGSVSFQDVLDQSLNNGAMEVGNRLGHDAFYSNLLHFGIGSPTGVDIAGEVNSPLRPQADWRNIDFADASFGQSVAATPVEMLAAVNTIANGGVWVQPHAVDAVVDPSTQSTTQNSPVTRRVVSPETAATLSKMMVGVVDDPYGSAFDVKMAAFKGQIAAKTGTADVAVNGRYDGQVIDSFAGFMPADHPRFTMLTIIRQPQHCNFQGHASACEGAYIAAPIWKQLAEVLVDDWKIVPGQS